MKAIGRIIYAVPLLIFGAFHFMNAGGMKGMVPGFLPGGVFWVYLTGVALLAAAVSLIIKTKVRLAMILLAVMLILFVLLIHVPSLMAEDANMQSIMPSLLKDTAMAGAALYFAGDSE